MQVQLAKWLRALYFIRVPLLAAMLLAIFSFLRLANIFSLVEPLQLFIFTLLGGLAWATLAVNVHIAWRGGLERFQLVPEPNLYFGVWALIGAGVGPGLLILAVAGESNAIALPLRVFCCLSGLFVAALVIFILRFLQNFLEPKGSNSRVFQILSGTNIIRRALNWAANEEAPYESLRDKVADLAQPFCRLIGFEEKGYFRPLPNGRVSVEPNQTFVIWLSAMILIFYVGFGAWMEWQIGEGGRTPPIPSIALFILAVMACTQVLSALAFFWDAYRVPVVLAVFLLTRLTSSVEQGDYFYPVQKNHKAELPTALQAWKSRRAKSLSSGKTMLVVATAGGGIQAAAWTTTVLAGLNDMCSGCSLPERLMAISAVSGGAIGAYHLAVSDWKTAQKNSRVSMLDEVGWGWMIADVWRGIAPIFSERLIDRGWALERSAMRISGDRGATMGDWGKAASDGMMPILLFNTTNVEEGKRVVISNAKTKDQQHGSLNWQKLYRDATGLELDIRAASAARLSAAFPFISPASRSNALSIYAGDYHLADGGYFDVYGLYSLMDLLKEVLPDDSGEALKIAVLVIEPFPSKELPAKEAVQALIARGGGFQLLAPLQGAYKVREAAQRANAFSALQQFPNQFCKHTIKLFFTRYKGPCPHCSYPPLAWSLTQDQQDCLEAEWDRTRQLPETKQLVDFLKE